MMMRVLRSLAIAFAALAAGILPVVAAPVPPDELVKQTIEEVLSIIRSDEKIQSGDVSRIAAVMEQKIAPHFDFPRMTRLAVGRPWRR